MTAITEPGVYNIGEDAYHADPVPCGSLSASGAKKLLPPSCPAIYAYERDHPPAPKRCFDLGAAAHKLVLGVGAELHCVDAADWRTNKAKAEAAEARLAGKVPLLAHEHAQVHDMAAALRRHKMAASLLNGEYGAPEQSLFWIDDRTGVWRRARLDWLPTGGRRPIIADYKTSVSANPEEFRRSVHNYGYHLQTAWYRDAVTALGLADEPQFVFVIQEKTAPYLVSVVQLDVEAELRGAELAREAIDLYQRCTETGHWPSYSEDEIPQIGLPAYALRAA